MACTLDGVNAKSTILTVGDCAVAGDTNTANHHQIAAETVPARWPTPLRREALARFSAANIAGGYPRYAEAVPEARRAAILLALVPVGTIVGHVVGYGIAGEHPGLTGDHSHLSPVVWPASILALATLAWLGVGGRRLANRLPLAWVVAGQATLFVALEAAEHLVRGQALHHVLTEPALRWGLLAQVATAAVLIAVAASARASGERIRALLSRRSHRTAQPAVSAVSANPVAIRSLVFASPASERGPPELVAAA